MIDKIESPEDAARWINENRAFALGDEIGRIWDYAYSALCRNIEKNVIRDKEYSLLCPHCESLISGGRPRNEWKFCPYCGQAINWGEAGY